MPYIDANRRDNVDHIVDLLASNINGIPELREKRDGVLNYVISRLLFQLYKVNYTDMNAALGVLDAASKEYYRCVVAPYEDKKRLENGEVYVDYPRERSNHE